MLLSVLLVLSCFLFCEGFYIVGRNFDGPRNPTWKCKNIRLPRSHNSQLTDLPNSQFKTVNINDELKSSFMSYAMSTILGRALPDARDGLKPVHRRVLHAMLGLGLTPDSSFRKCARIVGEVLGKYHPHGDQSVYDALVRMAQDFCTNHPLINGHGNFGSVDDDPPAAMRYTEAKISQVALDLLLQDVKENTVDFVPNFDGNEREPLVLPARLPLLVINGASGIAVGMATNIPPHNLGEVVDALVALIRNPNLTNEGLQKIIPAPDFPTGGLIVGTEGGRTFTETGRGSITIRAKTHIELLTKDTKTNKTAIIVTELPFMTNKAALLEKIADLVNSRALEGVSDLRDESDRTGIRIVIELKRDAIADVVLNNLYKRTGLQTSFPANMLALADNGSQPHRFSLREALEQFISFRFATVRRRAQHQLTKLQQRHHIVIGLLSALSRIDDIIKIIKTSPTLDAARCTLCSSDFKFSQDQAESILGLTLRRISSLEESRLRSESDDLMHSISDLNKLMINDSAIFETIIEESLDLKTKYAVKRRSTILEEAEEIQEENLLPNERSIIVALKSGYVKRLPLSMFEPQSRGGKGKLSTKLLSENDTVAHFFACNNHDAVLFIMNDGVAHCVKTHKIPSGSRTSRGVPFTQIVPVSSQSSITSIIPIDKFDDESYLLFLTAGGFIKKTSLSNFKSMTNRGLKTIRLDDGDLLQWVRRCRVGDDIIAATRFGYAVRFGHDEVRATGRYSRGVRAISLRKGDKIADFDVLKSEQKSESLSAPLQSFALAITQKGFGKRISLDLLKSRSRTGKGTRVLKFKGNDSKDHLCTLRVCNNNDDVVLSTRKGTVIRQPISEITLQSRKATGVLVQCLPDDDEVSQVDIVPSGDEQNSRALEK